MDKEALEKELLLVEAKMRQVDKGSRAYRAGEVIKASILKELEKLKEKG